MWRGAHAQCEECGSLGWLHICSRGTTSPRIPRGRYCPMELYQPIRCELLGETGYPPRAGNTCFSPDGGGNGEGSVQGAVLPGLGLDLALGPS
ncbi:hypothetical protein FKM82_029619 [Ascaphus truei]